MFFGRKASHSEGAVDASAAENDDDVPESERTTHGGYVIVPRVKQLHNGRWIVRVVLREEREGTLRRYDFAGPMSEYESAEEARRVGVEHAIARIDAQGLPGSA